MNHYQAVPNRVIKVPGKGSVKYENTPAIMVPLDKGRIYLHWYNENNKLVKTLTLDFPTKIFKPVTIVSGHDEELKILTLEVDKTY
jgi:hypothetical protein